MTSEGIQYLLDDTGQKKPSAVIGIERGSLPRSSNQLQEVVLSLMRGDRVRRVPGSFVEKKYNHYLGEAESVVNKHRKLQYIFSRALRRGEFQYMPLTPTMRLDRARNSIIITKYPLVYDKLTRPYAILSNKEECKAQLKAIASIAFAGGVYVSNDTYAIDVDPKTHIGRVILLDLDMGSYIMTDDWKAAEKKQGLDEAWWSSESDKETQKFLDKIDSFQDR